MQVYVINLDRRDDRLQDISLGLNRARIKFSKIQALDGSRDKSSPDSRFLSSGNQACWESHQLAFRMFLKDGATHALVLEDDAEVSALSNWFLSKMVRFMTEKNIGVLQIGFISHIYSFPRLFPFLQSLSAVLTRRVVRVDGLRLAVFGEFRAGTHAYIVSKIAARELVGANLPVTLAADNFMAALALANGRNSGVSMARLWRSQVGQRSRLSRSNEIDSDIA